MSKKHIFLSVFSKIAIFVCVFCAFFISPVFATLPVGYTELEYIGSDSKAYIDTGIAGGKTTFEIGVKFSYSSFVAYGAIYGNYVSDYHQGERCILAAGSNKIITNNETTCTTSGNTELTCNINDVHTLISKNTEVTLDGVTTVITNKAQGTENSGNIALFNRSITNPNTSRNIGAKVYAFYIKDSGALVRNFIPAKRNSDGEIGMYDTVSGTFFTNSGTGDFIAGPIAHCKTFGTDGVACTACKSGYKLDNSGGCVEIIEIATTKMVDDEFAVAEAKLATTVQTIESVVSRTITQTGQIQILQDTKQTRPDESCPANMKCLLVQDEDGTPHWYPIIEP